MLIGVFSHYFFGIAIFFTSVFLVLLVLVQRGRGGGLVGALGGPGGQSALGTKAGDVFTRITIVVAAIWIFLCAAAVRVLNPSSSSPLSGLDDDVPSASSLPGEGTTSSGVGGPGTSGPNGTGSPSGVGTGNVANPLGTPIPPAPPAPTSGSGTSSATSSGTAPVSGSAAPTNPTGSDSAEPATTPAATTPPAETPASGTENSANPSTPPATDPDSSPPADAPK